MGEEADYLWMLEQDDYYRERGSEPRDVKCRDCGSTNVYWAQENGLWVLYGTDSRKHKCDKKKLSAIRTDAFDPLD